MSKTIVVTLLMSILVFSLGAQGTCFSDEGETEQMDITRIMRKLEQITLNQEEIFKQFEEIKQELAIIKVRASRR